MAELNARELAIVLAGLRMIQRMGVWPQEQVIATDDGEFDPLADEEIDTLCERLNS